MRAMAFSLTNLGMVAQEQGDLIAARAYFDECLTIRRELGDPRAIPFALNNLALVARQQREYAAARAAYLESLSRSQQLNDTRGVLEALEGLAALAGVQGDLIRAAQLWGAVETLRTEEQMPRVEAERVRYERDLAAVRANTNPYAWEAAWSTGMAMSLKQTIVVASESDAPPTQRPAPPGIPDSPAPTPSPS